MPAKDSLGSDDQLWPGAAVEAAEEGRQRESLAGFQIGVREPSLKNANLVAKHEQLSFPIVGRTWAPGDEDGIKEEPKSGVGKGAEQRALKIVAVRSISLLESGRRPHLARSSGFCTPQGSYCGNLGPPNFVFRDPARNCSLTEPWLV
jgi:hypothetical protein